MKIFSYEHFRVKKISETLKIKAWEETEGGRMEEGKEEKES